MICSSPELSLFVQKANWSVRIFMMKYAEKASVQWPRGGTVCRMEDSRLLGRASTDENLPRGREDSAAETDVTSHSNSSNSSNFYVYFEDAHVLCVH